MRDSDAETSNIRPRSAATTQKGPVHVPTTGGRHQFPVARHDLHQARQPCTVPEVGRHAPCCKVEFICCWPSPNRVG